MFNLRDFVMTTLKGMVGHYPEFQVREFALNWYAKGTLKNEDMEEIEIWFMPPVLEDASIDVVLPEMEGGAVW